MKTMLLASAPDEAGIIKMIGRYWYEAESKIELLPGTVKNTFDVFRSGQRVEGFLVVLKGKRYRFEGVL